MCLKLIMQYHKVQNIYILVVQIKCDVNRSKALVGKSASIKWATKNGRNTHIKLL